MAAPWAERSVHIVTSLLGYTYPKPSPRINNPSAWRIFLGPQNLEHPKAKI